MGAIQQDRCLQSSNPQQAMTIAELCFGNVQEVYITLLSQPSDQPSDTPQRVLFRSIAACCGLDRVCASA